MKKITFEILHYLAINETIECIESIINNINYDSYCIVVVDNGSNKLDDVERLKKYESKYDFFYLIISDQNLGFAKGNNLGYKFAKDNLHSDFIVMMNNDVLIEQKDFCQNILEEYKNHNFAVLGPNILLKDRITPSNPMPKRTYNKHKLTCRMIFLAFLFVVSYVNLDMIIRKIQNKEKGLKNKTQLLSNEYQEDVVLHGACLIFSPIYINKFEGLNDGTFLYMEEDVLYQRIKKYGLKMVYSPKLQVTHLEDAATNMVNKTKGAKRRFVYKNHICSLKVLINELK